jgi:hypothetical protein
MELAKIKRGMLVYVDKDCKKTKKAYGFNDDMELNFLGKRCKVVGSGFFEPVVLESLENESGRSWQFKAADLSISPPVSFSETKKPKVKKVKFNPETL